MQRKTILTLVCIFIISALPIFALTPDNSTTSTTSQSTETPQATPADSTSQSTTPQDTITTTTSTDTTPQSTTPQTTPLDTSNHTPLTLDALIQLAMDNSQTIRTLEINHRNTNLSWQSQDLEDNKPTITLSTGNITVRKGNSQTLDSLGTTGLPTSTSPIATTPITTTPKVESSGSSDSAVFSLEPSLSVALPEKNNLSFTFGLKNSTNLSTSGNNSVSLTPTASLTKKIPLDTFTDTRDDISRTSTRAQQNLSYQKSLLQFRSSVIQAIISLIQANSSVTTSQSNYNRSVSDYQNDLLSGAITEGNLKDLRTQMNIETQRIALENAKLKYQNLLDNFKENFGIDYEKPEILPEANLDFTPDYSQTTAVLLADLALETANQALEVATGTSKTMTLGANLKTPFIYSNTKNSNTINQSINGSVSASLTGSNYSLTANAGANYTYTYNSTANTSNNNFSPYITISGSWSNKTNTEKTDLEIQSLKNKVTLAQIDYDNAIQTYNDSAKDILQRIEDLKTNMSQLEVSTKYNNLILERTLKMFDLGLSTQREVEDAQTAVDNDNTQKYIYQLQALLIENDIAILQL